MDTPEEYTPPISTLQTPHMMSPEQFWGFVSQMSQEEWDLAQQMWRGQTSGTRNEPPPDSPARAVPVEQAAVDEIPRDSPIYSPRVVGNTDAQVWQRAVEEVQIPPPLRASVQTLRHNMRTP